MSPRPTPADWEKARAIMAEYGADKDERWHADHGADALRQFAMLEMGKRQDAEFRDRIAPAKPERRAA